MRCVGGGCPSLRGRLCKWPRLSHRVFLNHNFSTTTKVAVYKAICISILLYDCGTWIPVYRRHIKILEAFHMRCLKSIGIRGGGTRSLMSKLYRAADIDTAEHMLLQRQLHWIGHVIRMQFQLSSPTLTLWGITQWAADAGWPKITLQGPQSVVF